MHADEIGELSCSHAFGIALHRGPCSCQQCFHVPLLKVFAISRELAGLPEVLLDSFFFL